MLGVQIKTYYNEGLLMPQSFASATLIVHLLERTQLYWSKISFWLIRMPVLSHENHHKTPYFTRLYLQNSNNNLIRQSMDI